MFPIFAAAPARWRHHLQLQHGSSFDSAASANTTILPLSRRQIFSTNILHKYFIGGDGSDLPKNCLCKSWKQALRLAVFILIPNLNVGGCIPAWYDQYSYASYVSWHQKKRLCHGKHKISKINKKLPGKTLCNGVVQSGIVHKTISQSKRPSNFSIKTTNLT